MPRKEGVVGEVEVDGRCCWYSSVSGVSGGSWTWTLMCGVGGCSGLSVDSISGRKVNATPKTVTSVDTMVAQIAGMMARLLNIQTIEAMSATMATAMIKRVFRLLLLFCG